MQQRPSLESGCKSTTFFSNAQIKPQKSRICMHFSTSDLPYMRLSIANILSLFRAAYSASFLICALSLACWVENNSLATLDFATYRYILPIKRGVSVACPPTHNRYLFLCSFLSSLLILPCWIFSFCSYRRTVLSSNALVFLSSNAPIY